MAHVCITGVSSPRGRFPLSFLTSCVLAFPPTRFPQVILAFLLLRLVSGCLFCLFYNQIVTYWYGYFPLFYFINYSFYSYYFLSHSLNYLHCSVFPDVGVKCLSPVFSLTCIFETVKFPLATAVIAWIKDTPIRDVFNRYFLQRL